VDINGDDGGEGIDELTVQVGDHAGISRLVFRRSLMAPMTMSGSTALHMS
jgi:hypothetical protein